MISRVRSGAQPGALPGSCAPPATNRHNSTFRCNSPLWPSPCELHLRTPCAPCFVPSKARVHRAHSGRACGTTCTGRDAATIPSPGMHQREGTSEAVPEAVRQAVGGGCQSGWGRLLSVTNAIGASHLPSGRQGLGIGWAPWGAQSSFKLHQFVGP